MHADLYWPQLVNLNFMTLVFSFRKWSHMAPFGDINMIRCTFQKRDEVKNSSVFQQILTKYFSSNTLHSVSPWLANLVSQDVVPADGASDKGSAFVYRPPLPNITTKPLSTFIQINPDPAAVHKVRIYCHVAHYYLFVTATVTESDCNTFCTVLQ